MRLVAVVAIVALACATSVACAGAPRFAMPFEAGGLLPALPALFAPLTWTTDPSSLGEATVWREPGAEDVVPFEHVSVDVAEWPALGPVSIRFMYVGRNAGGDTERARGAASFIELCNDVQALPLNAHGLADEQAMRPAAQRAFDVARAALEPELGPGRDDVTVWPGQAHGYERAPDEQELLWRVPGVTFSLDVGQQEEFAWYTCISALRAGAPWTQASPAVTAPR